MSSPASTIGPGGGGFSCLRSAQLAVVALRDFRAVPALSPRRVYIMYNAKQSRMPWRVVADGSEKTYWSIPQVVSGSELCSKIPKDSDGSAFTLRPERLSFFTEPVVNRLGAFFYGLYAASREPLVRRLEKSVCDVLLPLPCGSCLLRETLDREGRTCLLARGGTYGQLAGRIPEDGP